MSSPTGRNPKAPNIQPLLIRTEEGRKLREAMRVPEFHTDYAAIERRILAQLYGKD